MKQRMNILCIVILIFMVAMALSQFTDLFYSTDNSSLMLPVCVTPTHIGDDNMVTLTDGNTGSDVRVWVKEVILESTLLESKKGEVMKLIFMLPISVISLVTWFIFIIYLIRFVVAINKGKVFTWKTIRLLRTAGRAALISSVSMIAVAFYEVYAPSMLFVPQGYIYNYSYAIMQLPSLLPGLLLLLMAQIFGIGVKQKEELEQVV
ncbi:MAG: DUF2975 domain-containing protein [Porphyromonadaceae bacterium]